MAAFDLGEHIEELARRLGVVIIPPWVGSFADADEFPAGAAGHLELEDGGGFPVIWVSEDPTNAEAYLVALHELGHHRPTGPMGTRLAEERAAWFFAEHHSHIPITPRLREFIERRLDSYRDTSGS